MTEPRVSVIMAVHDGMPYLPAALASVLEQEVAGGLELILVDDGSTDGGSELLAETAARDLRVRLIAQENRGLTASLNRALPLARGRYLARQDSDDLSLPGRLAAQAALLDEDPEAAACGCWYGRIDEQGAVFAEVRLPDEPGVLLGRLRSGLAPFPHGAAMIRRRALEEAGGYHEGFRYAQDFELWLRLLAGGRRLRLAARVLYLLRALPEHLDPGSAKARFQAAARAEALAAFAQGRPAVAPRPPAGSGPEPPGPEPRELARRYHFSLARLAALDRRPKVAWRHFMAAGRPGLGAVLLPGLTLAAPLIRRLVPGLKELG